MSSPLSFVRQARAGGHSSRANDSLLPFVALLLQTKRVERKGEESGGEGGWRDGGRGKAVELVSLLSLTPHNTETNRFTRHSTCPILNFSRIKAHTQQRQNTTHSALSLSHSLSSSPSGMDEKRFRSGDWREGAAENAAVRRRRRRPPTSLTMTTTAASAERKTKS